MIKSANFLDCYDRAIFHNLTLDGALFAERQMGARSVVVAEILSQRPLQVPTVQNEKMIQTLPSYRSDQALGVSALPGALRRCQHLRNPHRLQTLPYLGSINAIPIADQIARCFTIGESLDNLLCNPS
jgi:hypothetical protein